jgi:sporulation protein YlmC with PRC-barrel domain
VVQLSVFNFEGKQKGEVAQNYIKQKREKIENSLIAEFWCKKK